MRFIPFTPFPLSLPRPCCVLRLARAQSTELRQTRRRPGREAPVRAADGAPRPFVHKHYDEPRTPRRRRPATPLAPRLQNLGVHTFPVSTKVARAQLFMNQGLNLTYGFNHAEAARAFAEAARLDPASRWPTGARRWCSVRTSTRRWTPEAEPKALALIQKAMALKGKATAARARLHRCAGGALHGQGGRSRRRRSRVCRRR